MTNSALGEASATGDLQRAADWRLRTSMGVTVGWLLLGFIYISLVVGWGDFVRQQAPELGGFLEGAFAPLAFLWLVVGFFLQQQQLRENTRTIQQQLEQMRRSAELAEVQARAIAADELHSRQDTFLRSAQLVGQQLSMICGWIVTSYYMAEGDVLELWRRSTQGEIAAFPMEIIRRILADDVTRDELFRGTELRAGHTERFIEAFERLLAAAQRCDTGGMLEEALRDGPHGRVYRMMTEPAPE